MTHPITSAPPVETWTVTKPVAGSPQGVVVSQHHVASDIGAQVLRDGGNAVDAAVTAGLAIGTVEPWMSGLGGCGYMVVHLAETDETWCVSFGVRASEAHDPAAYPLVEGADADLFGWPAVEDDRNTQGPLSIAVPGLVAGHAAALERFGTISWKGALGPAIARARAGLEVDWYATLKIASEAAGLRKYPESAATYLPGDLPPCATWGGPVPTIRLGRLANKLERLAHAGPRDFYEGDIAASLVADARDAGSPLTASDLKSYEADIGPALAGRYRETEVMCAPGLTAGPTLLHALSLIEQPLAEVAGTPDAQGYASYASALEQAYAYRLTTQGDEGDSAATPSCTTHISVVDGQGNVVALTQTLLSLFGSRVMYPGTGIMMNNGIMWFDPRPGRPNSMAPGKRPLSNMCPAVLKMADGRRFGLGASGGRRIMPAVFQLTSFLADFSMDLDTAVHTPRIDVSGGAEILADARLDGSVQEALAGQAPVTVVANAVSPALYACPSIVEFDPVTGLGRGSAYVKSPWAKASGA